QERLVGLALAGVELLLVGVLRGVLGMGGETLEPRLTQLRGGAELRDVTGSRRATARARSRLEVEVHAAVRALDETQAVGVGRRVLIETGARRRRVGREVGED